MVLTEVPELPDGDSTERAVLARLRREAVPVPGTYTLTGQVPLDTSVYRAILDRDRAFHGGVVHFEVALAAAPEGIRSVAGFQPEGGPGNSGRRWHLEGEHNQVSLLGGDW